MLLKLREMIELRHYVVPILESWLIVSIPDEIEASLVLTTFHVVVKQRR